MKLFYGNILPEVSIHPDEQQHITKVLRMKEGDEIFLTDGLGNSARGHLIFEGKKVHLNVAEQILQHPQISPKIHIAIAPTKNIDRTEFFLEKATELGAESITFLITDNTERKIINIDKLSKQSIAASKQSQRFYFPTVTGPVKISDFLKSVNPALCYVAHCDDKLPREPLTELDNRGELTFLIGPEGDFSNAEISLMAEMGISAVSLGEQRLRTETAGIFVAAWNYAKTFS